MISIPQSASVLSAHVPKTFCMMISRTSLTLKLLLKLLLEVYLGNIPQLDVIKHFEGCNTQI